MTEHDIQAENVYNTDETGFLMGHAQSRRVIEIISHPRDRNGRIFPADFPELNLRGGQTLQDGSQEFATAICCICVDGTFLDSAIIFKAQDLQDSWFANMADVPKDILFGVSPNEWTDNSKLEALAWLERSFGPGSASEKKATTNGAGGLHDGLHGGLHGGLQPETQAQSPSRKWRLLMFDGHISHVNKAFLHRCLDYQVLPGCLPPHTTHFLQPLDVSVFGPLKHAYSDLLQAQYAKGEHGVWMGNFYKLFDSAQKKAFTSANILRFCHTGLWPVKFSIVEERMKFGLSEPLGPSHTVTTVTPPTLYDCI